MLSISKKHRQSGELSLFAEFVSCRLLRLRLHGAGRILGRSYIGSVTKAIKGKVTWHCVYTGPVCQVNGMQSK